MIDGAFVPETQWTVVEQTRSIGASVDARQPMELGFDPLLSRFEPRLFFFSGQSLRRRSIMSSRWLMPPHREQHRRGMIGMITASARHHRPCRQRNGTKPKFFNDFARARAGGRSG
jgi:hypothetical protein